VKKIAIIGLSGRMGAELLALAPQFKFEVIEGVGRSKLAAHENITVVDQVSKLNSSKIDVVIDFSLPELTNDVIAWCVANKKPLVSGVTGIGNEQKLNFEQAGAKIATLWAPNMSLGVAVLSRMLNELKNLKGFDFQIEEVHHKHKKDKPSGTALYLQQKLELAIGEAAPEPVAIRGGGVFGIHRVLAMGEEETLTLEHNAINRRVFARGALKAAQWLVIQKPGFYVLNDVLNDAPKPVLNA
jgi:4-hydroxy-tetrahydrodipicolinate reductase